MAIQNTWLQLLRKVFIFSSFSGDQLNTVAKKMKLTSLPKGAVVFDKGDAGDSFYLIISGSVRIIDSQVSQNTPANGNPEESTLVFLDRGDALGEMSLLAGEPYTHRAVVDKTAEFLVLTKKDFDHLLEKDPTMGVHLSRILSGRLASFHKGQELLSAPAKIYSIFPLLSPPDQAVFSINLGLALVEQTRRKVLMVMVGCGGDLLAPSLKLDNSGPLKEPNYQNLFESRDSLNEAVRLHPSGLELLFLDPHKALPPMGENIHRFLDILKSRYDYCLFFFPSSNEEVIQNYVNSSDRIWVAQGSQTNSESINSMRQVESRLRPTKKIERIWLYTETAQGLPVNFSPQFRIPWEEEWGRSFMKTGIPYIPAASHLTHRMVDRLARSLGELTIGFAMGSGAAYGYALIGIVRVLEKNGIYPDVLSGTSMGALIGSFYTSGLNPDQMEEIAISITRKKLWSMIELSFPRSGILTGQGILKFLRSHLGDKTFNDLQIPFACVATDIESGKEIVIQEGSVAEAVRASLSLPFFFQPHYMQGRYLVDGGLVNPVPTSIIVNLGAKILLSANLTSKTGERRIPKIGWRKQLPTLLRGPSIPEILMKTIYTMQYEIASARSEIAHVVMRVNSGDHLWWDLDKAKNLIRMGEATAEESLPKIKSLLPFFSDSCKVRLMSRALKSY